MSQSLPIRVMLLDTWDEMALELPSSTSIADLKQTVLQRARVRRPAADYVVKYHGAELYEPGNTLAAAGVSPNAAMIVLLRRRTPVW
jgi:hypothetical protein